MPIRLQISHLERMVVGVSEGTVTLRDIGDFLDGIVKAGARPYRKLFDASEGISGLSEADLKALATRLHRPPKPDGLGPFAIVARQGDRSDLVRVLRPFASLDRPMRVFANIRSARGWLENQALVL
jgi:hypothetical protein